MYLCRKEFRDINILSRVSHYLSVQRMAWVTFKSPLWRKEIVQDKVKPLPSLKVKRKMEQEFVNDGVRTTNGTNRRKPIIPPYNALRDRYAQAYFQSPLVKAMKERNFHLKVRNIKSFLLSKL